METVFRGEFDEVDGGLRDSGADMQEVFGEITGTITVDREVVSGGSPLTANALGDEFLEILKA